MSNGIKDYVCFDLETTGFGKTAEIIEIGAVKVRNGVIVDKFSELVKPVNPISSEVTALTGISQNDVENARNISAVLPDFLKFIENDILLGHNIATFDIPIVRRYAALEMKSTFEPKYIDTLYLAQNVNGIPDHKLQTLLDHYGIENARAHRAFEDCEATNMLFAAMIADGIVPDVKRSYAYSSVEDYYPVPLKDNIDFHIDSTTLPFVDGLCLVLTGNFNCCPRTEVETILTEMGAKVRKAISSKTDYLIVGNLGSDQWRYNNGGDKMLQAKQLGVKIIPEIAISNLIQEYKEHNQLTFDDFVTEEKKSEPDLQLNAENSFSCCGNYRECSARKQCLHSGEPEYDGCIYRQNLESGRIFYGKNAVGFNIDTYNSIKNQFLTLSPTDREQVFRVVYQVVRFLTSSLEFFCKFEQPLHTALNCPGIPETGLMYSDNANYYLHHLSIVELRKLTKDYGLSDSVKFSKRDDAIAAFINNDSLKTAVLENYILINISRDKIKYINELFFDFRSDYKDIVPLNLINKRFD